MGLKEWLGIEDEGDRIVGEISNDRGDHVVFDVPAEAEGEVRRIMRQHRIESDRDEREGFSRRSRDPDQHRYHMKRVVDPNEDLEPEQDDDSIREHDEQSASGGWFSWF